MYLFLYSKATERSAVDGGDVLAGGLAARIVVFPSIVVWLKSNSLVTVLLAAFVLAELWGEGVECGEICCMGEVQLK